MIKILQQCSLIILTSYFHVSQAQNKKDEVLWNYQYITKNNDKYPAQLEINRVGKYLKGVFHYKDQEISFSANIEKESTDGLMLRDFFSTNPALILKETTESLFNISFSNQKFILYNVIHPPKFKIIWNNPYLYIKDLNDNIKLTIDMKDYASEAEFYDYFKPTWQDINFDGNLDFTWAAPPLRGPQQDYWTIYLYDKKSNNFFKYSKKINDFFLDKKNKRVLIQHLTDDVSLYSLSINEWKKNVLVNKFEYKDTIQLINSSDTWYQCISRKNYNNETGLIYSDDAIFNKIPDKNICEKTDKNMLLNRYEDTFKYQTNNTVGQYKQYQFKYCPNLPYWDMATSSIKSITIYQDKLCLNEREYIQKQKEVQIEIDHMYKSLKSNYEYNNVSNIDAYKYISFLNKKNVGILNDIAFYLERDHDLFQSKIILEKIVEQFPDRIVAKLNLADVYWKLKTYLRDTPDSKILYQDYMNLMIKKGIKNKIPKRVYERIK